MTVYSSILKKLRKRTYREKKRKGGGRNENCFTRERKKKNSSIFPPTRGGERGTKGAIEIFNYDDRGIEAMTAKKKGRGVEGYPKPYHNSKSTKITFII